MRVILHNAGSAILRFDLREEVLGTLQAWCETERIFAADFSAIGAASSMELSWYDTEEKRYADKLIEGKWEIVSMIGFIAQKDGHAHVHAHGGFSDEFMNMQGGHIKKLIVGATCEMALRIHEGSIERGFDEATGLHLMK